ncbi:complement factor H-related protein 2 [Coregonus clupeaformis]|uniref:complement factor H-related protein 2 n=1 Tax=Coregonus clupeaformis TaxID=59861 RepID=UPI001BDFCEAA|nr:complement factor H-related protein 2 [Coregonus clupeaformis]XP_041751604.1 complement factor H-related protein 2 [Coregonus clupeaformis]
MGYLFSREMGEPKGLVFALLIWCLLTVHALGSQQSCQKPQLDKGYFDSDEGTYPLGTELYYACDKGLKPVAEGWWAIVKCENSKWSHTPLCIEENDCIAPDNPNAKVIKPNVNGWHPNGDTVRFECDAAYKMKSGDRVSSKCENGIWTKLPLCVEKANLCEAPPPVTNAVITHEYQDKFPDGSIVHYKCQNSYTLAGTDSIVCLSGKWTPSPTCIKTPSPTERASTGEGGHSTSGDRGNGGTSRGGDHIDSIGDESSPNVRPTARPQPSGKILPVDRCGAKPTVDNGDFITVPGSNQMALTYKCINYYKLVGPEKVMCRSDRTWSELPTCKAPCTIEKKTFDQLDLPKDMFVKEGESQTFLCKEQDYYRRPLVADVRCQNGHVTIDRCTLGCKLEPRNHHWLGLAQDVFIKEGTHRLTCGQTDSYGRPLVADVRCENGYPRSTNCS